MIYQMSHYAKDTDDDLSLTTGALPNRPSQTVQTWKGIHGRFLYYKKAIRTGR